MSFAAIIAGAGVAVSALGAYGKGQAAKAEAEHRAAMQRYNARVNEMNAKAAIEKAKFDQLQFQKRAQKIQGATRAKLGMSGALMTEGAPIALLGAQAAELALDSSLIGYEGMVQARKFKQGAALNQAQAKLFERQGRAAERASYWNIGSSLLSGFGSMASSGMFSGSSGGSATPLTSTFGGKMGAETVFSGGA